MKPAEKTHPSILLVFVGLAGLLAQLSCHPVGARAPEGMVYIPAGPFLLGRPMPGGQQWPVQKVQVEAFFMDRYEVTLGQYQRFVDETGYKAPFVEEAWAQPYNWVDGKAPPNLGRHPVTLVNWHDADAYCRWAGKRLPTSFEWDKAARGTDGRIFPWGNVWRAASSNHGKAEPDPYDASDGYELTSPVGAFPEGRGPYGLEDAFGNAWEWTASWYTLKPPPPPGPDGVIRVKTIAEDGLMREARGGSFYFDLEHDWRGERQGMLPEIRRKTSGFRCAKDIGPQP